MIRTADGYGQVLFNLHIKEEVIADCKELLDENPALVEALSNPSVTSQEKHRIIDQLFPEETKSFLKVLCDNGQMGDIQYVEYIYEKCLLDSKNIVEADLVCANELNPVQIDGLKQMIMKKYKKADVRLTVKKDPSLVGGFVLQIGDQIYDRSVKGRLSQLYRQMAWR